MTNSSEMNKAQEITPFNPTQVKPRERDDNRTQLNKARKRDLQGK